MPTPIGAHDALVAESRERAERAGQRLVVVVVGIVDERDIDAVETEPVEALLERAQRGVVGEVEVRLERRRALPRRRSRTKEPADLRRHDELVARPVA